MRIKPPHGSGLADRVGWIEFRPIRLLGLALCLSATGVAFATDCVDYRDYIHRACTVELTMEVTDVAVRSGHAFVVDDWGLHIFDVDDPGEPLLVGELAIQGAKCLALRGDYAYVGCHDSDFRAVDVSDPDAPWICGSLTIHKPATDMELDGDYAYVAVGHAGIEIVDISDPTTPDYYTVVDTPDEALDVAIQGDYAYIADRQQLVIIDVSDLPTSPVIASGRPGPNLISVAVSGNHAYLLDTTFGIHVYDVSDPLDPQWLGDLPYAGEGHMEIVGNRLYVGAYPGLVLLDISVPDAPRQICEVNTSGPPRGISVDGDHVYQAIRNPGSLDIIDASNPASPPERGQITLYGWPYYIAMAEPYAYLACRFYGVRVVDVSDPAAMVDLGYVDGVEYARHIVLDGALAYVAGEYEGLYILDITKPAAPQLVSNQPMGRSTCCVVKQGNYVYLTNWDGLRIVDVTEPADPDVIAWLNTDWEAHYVAVRGDYALVATTLELLLVDVGDPYDPQLVESFDIKAKTVCIEGDFAYVSTLNWLTVYSVTELPEFELVGDIPLPNYTISACFAGNLAYLANGAGGLQVLDVSDPTAPHSIGSIPYWPLGVFASEQQLFISDYPCLYAFPLHCDLTAIHEQSMGTGDPPDALARLHQNRPNPFNPSTSISYTLMEPAEVSLRIYDCGGRLVRTLRSAGLETAGLHELAWEGLDEQGRQVSSGVYLCCLEANGQVAGRRMILLK